jgi:outer membrane protein
MRIYFVLAAAIPAVSLAQTPPSLTLQEAEQLALRNHPSVAASQLSALASRERVVQAEAARHPVASASLTGAGAPENSRIASGMINNPIIYSRMASGVSVNQLLFDFGRTSHLIQTSKLAAHADSERVNIARADLLLSVRRAYFDAARARTLLDVALHTVEARQLVVDQVTELVRAQLKSALDLSFAETNLAEGKLLLAAAENQREAAMANLAQTMGLNPTETAFDLAEVAMPPVEPFSFNELLETAMRRRPEIAAARLELESSRSFVQAERSLRYPTVNAMASAGIVPTRATALSSDYAAVGVTVTLPFLNGGLFKSREREAQFRAASTERSIRDLELRVARDIRLALLDVNTASQRIALTEQFVTQAGQALELAQARYDLGLSSIVELSQAQLVKTNAEIQYAAAKYEYQIQRSILEHRAGLLQ